MNGPLNNNTNGVSVNVIKIISDTTNNLNHITTNSDNKYTNISNIPVAVRDHRTNYNFTILTTRIVNFKLIKYIKFKFQQMR